jgi:DNA replication protein DnaC
VITSSSAMPLHYDVPFRCRDASPEQLDPSLQEQLWRAMRERYGALLLGPTGVGKTFAMMAARKVIESERVPAPTDARPLFVDWPEFVADVETFDELETPDRERFNPIMRLGLWRAPVFIDDIGLEPAENKYRKPTAPFLASVIRQREKFDYPLWITANLSESEIRQRYGEPTLSRLFQHCLFVDVRGVDRRIAS